MRCTVASPSPVPLSNELRNGWKMRSMSAGSMPQPSSSTRSPTVCPSDASTARRRRPPSAMARRPLVARFHTIWRIWLSSNSSHTGSGGTSTSTVWCSRTSAPLRSSRAVSLTTCARSNRVIVGALRTRVGQERPDRLVEPIRLAQHDVHELLLVVGERQFGAQHLQRARHRGERIADFVGDAGRHLPHRRQALAHAGLALEPLDVGDVLEGEEIAGAAVGERQARGGDAELDVAAVLGAHARSRRAGCGCARAWLRRLTKCDGRPSTDGGVAADGLRPCARR